VNDRLVVKVGGSLLEWPELPARLAGVLDARRGSRPALLAGGGAAADLIRRLDAAHRLGEEASHALALRALDLTAHALARLVPDGIVVDAIPAVESAWSRGLTPIVAPRPILDADDGSPDALRHSWQITSDSIAARLAVLLRADTLLLLKSAPAPRDVPEAVRLGRVDPAFAVASAPIRRVLYLNLRGPDPAPQPLPREGP